MSNKQLVQKYARNILLYWSQVDLTYNYNYPPGLLFGAWRLTTTHVWPCTIQFTIPESNISKTCLKYNLRVTGHFLCCSSNFYFDIHLSNIHAYLSSYYSTQPTWNLHHQLVFGSQQQNNSPLCIYQNVITKKSQIMIDLLPLTYPRFLVLLPSYPTEKYDVRGCNLIRFHNSNSLVEFP